MSEPKPHQKPIECIGIILDGNRRWAKAKGLPTLEGHRRGFENLKMTADLVRDRGIPHLAVYAFSTENWNRSEKEIVYLMDMIREAVRGNTQDFVDKGFRVHFVGDRSRLDKDIQEILQKAENDSAHNNLLTLWVCLSYGGRAEIVSAARSVAGKSEEITEETIVQHLWTEGMPDPDIIIRTGGQKRLSNFLMWQSAYSELFFLDTLWPDFGEKELDEVLSEFKERKRNFGV